MRWTKLSDKMPPLIEECHLRYTNDREKVFYESLFWEDRGGMVHRTVPAEERTAVRLGQWGAGGRYELSEIEWLDESEPTKTIADLTDDQVWEIAKLCSHSEDFVAEEIERHAHRIKANYLLGGFKYYTQIFRNLNVKEADKYDIFGTSNQYLIQEKFREWGIKPIL